jgi:hypothetical protein
MLSHFVSFSEQVRREAREPRVWKRGWQIRQGTGQVILKVNRPRKFESQNLESEFGIGIWNLESVLRVGIAYLKPILESVSESGETGIGIGIRMNVLFHVQFRSQSSFWIVNEEDTQMYKSGSNAKVAFVHHRGQHVPCVEERYTICNSVLTRGAAESAMGKSSSMV